MTTIPLTTTYETDLHDVASKSAGKLVIKSMITGKMLEFPAFITSLSQVFTSNWNEESVYGRMDPIATFQNTRRAISLSFTLPAANKSIAKDHLSRCDLLAQFLYPGYIKQKDIDSNTTQGNVIARPPLVAVQFANLISTGGGSRQLGWMSGLEWTPDLAMGVFVDGSDIYPKVINLSFTLNVLHQADKGFGEDNKWLSESEGFFGGTIDLKPPKKK
jgi:hypothetical protein